MKNWFVSSCLILWSNVALADDIEQAQKCLRAIDLPCARQILDRKLVGDGDDQKTLTLKASVLFHEGKYNALEETLRSLNFPEKDDAKGPPYRATISASKGLKEYNREGISIRHGTGVEHILAFEAWDVLNRGKKVYGGLFGGIPSHELVMDIFPTAARFILGSGLPPEAVRTTGVIALSKWSRLLLTSPRTMSRGYAWKDTASHEYIHLVVAWRTADKAPVWLQEGLAKYYEGAWRGNSENYLSSHQQTLLAKALKEDSFVPFEKFRYSMAYLDSSEEAALAFAQVSSMIAFFETKAGRQSISTLMDEVRNGVDSQQAVASLAGYSDFNAFKSDWRKYIAGLPLIQDKLLALPVALDGVGGEFADDPLLSVRHDLAKYVRLGDLLMEKNRPKAALIEYEKAKDDENTPSPLLIARKAQCMVQLKQMADAKDLAQEGVRLYPEFPLLLTTLAKIHVEQKEPRRALVLYRRAHDLNPFDVAVQNALSELYTIQNDPIRAQRHQQYASILNAGGGGAAYLTEDATQDSIDVVLIAVKWGQVSMRFKILLDSPLSDPTQTELIKEKAREILNNSVNALSNEAAFKEEFRTQIAMVVNPLLLPNRIIDVQSIVLDPQGD